MSTIQQTRFYEYNNILKIILPFQAIPVSVDHSDDSQVVKLFERIKSENDGKLDVCVNNAYAGKAIFIQCYAFSFGWLQQIIDKGKKKHCQIVLFQLKNAFNFCHNFSVENCRKSPMIALLTI